MSSNLKPIFNSFSKKTKYSFQRLEIHIVDHCNLNCRACAHFSNISPEKYLDIHLFEKDLSEIIKKIDYKLLNILGGEPLLHPDIEVFFDKARQICPDIDITMTTNGLLLPEMKKEFWESLNKNEISIRLSVYPVTLKNAQKYIEIIKMNNAKIWDIWDGRNFYLKKSQIANSPEEATYKACDATICHQLYQGKIYPCPIAAYGSFYNKHFNRDFFYSDGIDIYQNSAEEIHHYLTNPVINCRTCTQAGAIVDWSKSGFKEDEWDA